MTALQTYEKLFCGTLIIASVTLSIILLVETCTPQMKTFSYIGEQNRALFFIWGISTGAATFFNLKLLAKRLQFKNRTFDWILGFGCSTALVMVTVTGFEPLNYAVHMASAKIFGIIGGVCLLILMLIRWRGRPPVPTTTMARTDVRASRKNKIISMLYIIVMIATFVVLVVATARAGHYTAPSQLLLTNVFLVVMFCSNFLEK